MCRSPTYTKLFRDMVCTCSIHVLSTCSQDVEKWCVYYASNWAGCVCFFFVPLSDGNHLWVDPCACPVLTQHCIPFPLLQVLDHVEQRRAVSKVAVYSLLSSLIANPFPAPVSAIINHTAQFSTKIWSIALRLIEWSRHSEINGLGSCSEGCFSYIQILYFYTQIMCMFVQDLLPTVMHTAIPMTYCIIISHRDRLCPLSLFQYVDNLHAIPCTSESAWLQWIESVVVGVKFSLSSLI